MKYSKQEKRLIKAKYGIRPLGLWLLVVLTKERKLLNRINHRKEHYLLHPNNQSQMVSSDIVQSLIRKDLLCIHDDHIKLTPKGFELASKRLDASFSKPY